MMERVLQGVMDLGKAGVVHTDLSPYNILVADGSPWFIDLSEAIRVDRTGDSPYTRLTEAERALRAGLASLERYFRRFGLGFDPENIAAPLMREWDRFGVMR